MPLVTNLDSDDEGLLELVDGQELIIRNRSQTKLDVHTDSDDEDHDLSNNVGNGAPGKKRLSAGARRRMSMGSVATYGSMPEEYSFDHVGLDGTHTTISRRPVSVSATGALKNDAPGGNRGQHEKVICEIDLVPPVDQKRRSNRKNGGGSTSSRDISVASLGTAPNYHAGKGPCICKGHGATLIEDASTESGLLFSPYHAGQGPYIKGGLVPGESLSKQKTKKSSRLDKDFCPPTEDSWVKKNDTNMTGKQKSRRSDTKKSLRSHKGEHTDSRRSRTKTANVATQTDISASDIEKMEFKIESQETELNTKEDGWKAGDSTVDEALHNLDLQETEEDRVSSLEQEVVALKLHLAQAQADLQEAHLQILHTVKERDEVRLINDDAERACEELRKMVEEIQNDSRKERLQNQMQGTSSRLLLQKQSSLMSQSVGNSHQGPKNCWSTGIFGNLSGVLELHNLSESEVEEPADIRERGSNWQTGSLKRDMAQLALLDGENKQADTWKNESSIDQKVHDDDPFATVYNEDSADEEDLDEKRSGPFGFGMMRRRRDN